MIAGKKIVVRSCIELTVGDDIDARYKGALVHRGRVTEMAPEHGLFWIMDELTGGRRLVDMAELEIVRVQGPVIPDAADTEPAAAVELVRHDPTVSGARIAVVMREHGHTVTDRTGLRWRDRATAHLDTEVTTLREDKVRLVAAS